MRVFGEKAREHRNVRGRIGLAPPQDALLDRFSAFEFVELAGKTHGVADPSGEARRTLAYVDLDPEDPKRVGAFSKGMRQSGQAGYSIGQRPRPG